MKTFQLEPGAIVVGDDGSDGARAAVSWAADLAVREHRPLAVLTSSDPLMLEHLAPGAGFGGVDPATWTRRAEHAHQVVLDAARERVRTRHPELRVDLVSDTQDARDALVEASRAARLVVVGSRGRGRVARLLLGSVGAAVARHAHGPVAVVPPAPADADAGADATAAAPAFLSGRVRAVVESGRAGTQVLEAACRLASATSHRVVVHPVDAGRTDDAEADGGRALRALAARLTEKFPDVDLRIDPAAGHGEVLAPSTVTCHDVVVVGRGDHRAHLRPVTYQTLLELRRAPVVVVPADD